MTNIIRHDYDLGREGLLSRLLHKDFAGYTCEGLQHTPFDITELVSLRATQYEGGSVSKQFRQLVGVPAERKIGLFSVVNADQKRLLHMYYVQTKDVGLIPAIFGSMDIFPLDINKVIDANKDFIEATGRMHVVDKGHREYIIHDVQNYTIPNRVYSHYKKAKKQGLTLKVFTDLISLYSQYQTAYLSDIQTSLYYAGFIKPETDDSELLLLEEIYSKTHSMRDHVNALQMIHGHPKQMYGNYPYVAIMFGNGVMGNAHLQVNGKNWYWLTSNRLRLKSIASDFNFNINDAVICSLIEQAKELGCDTFNLGLAEGFDYKQFYKPEVEYRKGVRFNSEAAALNTFLGLPDYK